jgi:excisionase family DNA binding protein
MSQRLYSVDQVAERLGLHVRTIRNYVRDGRLKAVRIGKQYRIAHEDLEALAGRPLAPVLDRETVRRRRHVEVSSVVQVDAISPADAERVTMTLTSATISRRGGEPLRIETVYDEERARMKVIVLGGLDTSAAILELLAAVVGTRP